MTFEPNRVLQLTDSNAFAGTERLILELSGELRNNAWQSTIGCPIVSPLADLSREEKIEVFDVHRPKGKNRIVADVATVSKLRSYMQKGQVDLIHIHNGRAALLSCLAGGGRLVPMVMSQHFLKPARSMRKGAKAVVSRLLHRWIESRITRHIAISEAVSQAMICQHGTCEVKLSVVHNGIRDPRSETINAGEASRLFCAARAEPEKDLPTLVRAIALARQSLSTISCLIAGEGRERTNVQSLINSLEMSEQIRLLGFRNDVRALMAACELFVLPAVAEPFGLVLLEAMALGKPVIACDAGGPREIVLHGKTGLLVPPGSSQDMANAIVSLLQSEMIRSEMERAARLRYEQLFTADIMAKNMIMVYRQALREWAERAKQRHSA